MIMSSGTPNACQGKHFSVVSPKGVPQENNGCLEGIPVNKVALIQYSPRASDGNVCLRQDEILEAARAKARAHPHAVVILHIVCGSKTGLIYPSAAKVKELKDELQGRLLVVVDACQLRCRVSVVAEFVSLGFMVLVTGSKFFAGPPFSGAVLFPREIADVIELNIQFPEFAFPSGLASYISEHEVPPSMPRLREHLRRCGGDWTNFPLTLRWHCALATMERYRALNPSHVDRFVEYWVAELRNIISLAAPYLEVIKSDYESDDLALAYNDEMPANVNSVVSLLVRICDRGEMRVCSFEELKRLFEALANGERTKIMLGQPVKLSSQGGLSVLRIALGADMVIAALENNSDDPVTHTKTINSILEDDRHVVSRMVDVLKSWSTGSAVEQRMLRLRRDLHLMDSYISSTPLPPCRGSTTSLARISQVVQGIMRSHGSFPDVALLYDLDAINCALSEVRTATMSHRKGLTDDNAVLHCFAMKSCPVSFIAHHMILAGLGIEAASILEVTHALQLGCPPTKVVFDSPCKTVEELRYALSYGVAINANSITEVEKIAVILKENGSTTSVIGVRVNPLIGEGSIGALSTATAASKFGIPFTEDDAGKSMMVDLFRKHTFLTMIMCHVGSQGMSVSSLVSGALIITRYTMS